MGSPILDEHFRWLETIQASYKRRNDAPEYLEQAIAACEAQIALAPKAARAFLRTWDDSPLPSHTGYKQLSIIREKQGQLDEALRLAEAASAGGWSGDWDRRIERLQRKLNKREMQGDQTSAAGRVEEEPPDENSWSPITCLCGARLRVRPDKLNQPARCPGCKGAVYPRTLPTSSNPYETICLNAEKASNRGKARWRTPGGKEEFIEEVVLASFRQRGWRGIWGENNLWWVLWSLLFWEVIYARIDGVWDPNFGDFPSEYQDMPRDLFKPTFYTRRQSLIQARVGELESEVNLAAVLRTSYQENYGQKCRLIENWNKFSLEVLCEVVSAVPTQILIGIFERLMMDFAQNRSGLPDLVLWNSTSVCFAEVKGKSERLSEGQTAWIETLRALGTRIVVVRVFHG